MSDRTYTTDDYEDELEWEDNTPSYDSELDFNEDPETEYLPEDEDTWEDEGGAVEDE